VNAHNGNNDEIDLRDLFAILKEKRKSIFISVLISTVLLIGTLLIMPKSYESIAVLSLGDISKGITIPTFRSIHSVYSNINLFDDYLSHRGENADWRVDENFFRNTIEPIYGYDKKSTVSIDENTVLGLKITCVGPSPEEARNRVVLLGTYVETVILNNWIWEYTNLAKGEANSSLSTNNSEILQAKFEIENLNDKGKLLESKFLGPKAMRSTFEAQIVQVDEVTEKYLSPQQQLVSVRVSIKNNEIKVKTLERNLRMNRTMLSYLSQIEGSFDAEKRFMHDSELLDKINAEKENFFAQGEQNNNASKELYFSIAERFDKFFNLRNAQYKFISGPTLNADYVKPQILILSVIGFLVFMIFFTGRALVQSWWKS